MWNNYERFFVKRRFNQEIRLDFFSGYVIIISFCETVFIEPPPTAPLDAIGIEAGTFFCPGKSAFLKRGSAKRETVERDLHQDGTKINAEGKRHRRSRGSIP